MKKALKWIVAFAVVTALLWCAVAMAASVYKSGTCGTWVNWTLDYNKVLSIAGSGEMYNYGSSSPAPWCERYLIPSIEKVIIGNGVTSIGSYAFYNHTELTQITIPASVTSIGGNAFNGCTGLTSITLPEGFTSIGANAFNGCTGLTSITLPNSVTSIGYSAFRNCINLTSITIPEGVTSIGDYAFYGCSSLTSITLPNSVSSIGVYAFYGCSSLTSITLPSTITIGDAAFRGCTQLANDDGFIIVQNELYGYVGTDTTVIIPNGITIIQELAFNGCDNLTSVTIPDSVTSICYHAFNNCSSLTTLTIPNSVTSVDDIISQCGNLNSISIFGYQINGIFGIRTFQSLRSKDFISGAGNVYFLIDYNGIMYLFGNGSTGKYTPKANIEYRSWCNLYVKTVIIMDGVTMLGERFLENSGIGSICFSETVTSIGRNAFQGCTSLTSITIPEGVTSISDYTFYGCSGLTSITIPDSVTSIGGSAFVNCYSLETIIIPVCNSYAHNWAKANGYSAIVTEHQQVLTEEAIAATCTETGLTAGSHCEVCGEILAAQEVVDALGHTPVNDPAVAPTDTEPGLTEGSHCEVCGEVFTAQIRIHPLVWEIESTAAGITILKHYGTDANCSIPTMINGVRVAAIAADAFTGENCPANVYIPAGVDSISNTAFSAPATVYCHMYSEADYWVDDVGYSRVYVDDAANGTFYLITMPESFTMEVGTSRELGATVWPLTGAETVSITSSDPTVVAADGQSLTALAIGTADITLQVGGMSASVTVATFANPTDFSIGDEITGSDELVIITRTNCTITASNIQPIGAELILDWESDNTGVATVEPSGDQSAVITAKRAGTATITATSQNGIVRTCTVTVCLPVTMVSFAQEAMTVGNGCREKVTAIATTSDGMTFENRLVTFTSSDETIATVDANGVVHGVSMGTVTITVAAVNDASITATFTVTVREPIVFSLPASLTTIESEAFVGLPNADAIRIPASVTAIADDAFDPGVTLIVPSGSRWVQWATDHGYGVVEE